MLLAKKYLLLLSLFIALTATDIYALKKRYVKEKNIDAIVTKHVEKDIIEIKFNEGSKVKLRNGQFISERNIDLSGINELFFDKKDIEIRRMFDSVSEEKLAEDKRNGELKSGNELADLNLWYVCRVTRENAQLKLLKDLLTNDLVETAYFTPIPAQNKVETSQIISSKEDTPDFSDMQSYLDAAPTGVGARLSWTLPGGNGENVKWIDVETGWYWDHEDLPDPFYSFGAQMSYNKEHGTGVLGIVSGVDNGFGVKGIASAAPAGWSSVVGENYPVCAQGFYGAYNGLDEGDVFLIELHWPGPNASGTGQQGYILMEYWQSNFDAIQTATANGVHCIEPAGNGEEDLDDPIYENLFNREFRDSGAIVVGAGNPNNSYIPSWFTNYGSIVDLFGWGSSIVSTGYGDLFGSPDTLRQYTQNYGGTSGASPICTGALMCVQSINKEFGYELIPPVEMRFVLNVTGTSQNPNFLTDHLIGKMPNIYKALKIVIGTGMVQGIITDSESGEILEDVLIELKYPHTITESDTTNIDGYYSFESCLPIEYELTISKDGYSSLDTAITILVDNVIDLNLSLTPFTNLLNQPESVEYYEEENIYLVSNWGSGEIISIDENFEHQYFNTELTSVAGIKIYNDKLFCADRTGLGIIDLETKSLDMVINIEGDSLLNDFVFYENYIYVSDYWDPKIYKIDMNDNYSYEIIVEEDNFVPNGMLLDEENNRILICSRNNNGTNARISALDLSTEEISTIITTPYFALDGIAKDSEGNIYISSWSMGSSSVHGVFKYDSDFQNTPGIISNDNQGPADIFINQNNNTLAIPNLSSNTVDFISLEVGIEDDNYELSIMNYELKQNYPNPFNPLTRINYELRITNYGLAEIMVLNSIGQEIWSTTVGAKSLSPAISATNNNGSIEFDGSKFNSGVYYYSLVIDGKKMDTKAMLLIK